MTVPSFSIKNAKIVCALYDDPVEGYPPSTPEIPFHNFQDIQISKK